MMRKGQERTSESERKGVVFGEATEQDKNISELKMRGERGHGTVNPAREVGSERAK